MHTGKNILINASTVYYGGGLIVSRDIINAVISCTTGKITLICPEIETFKIFESKCDVIYIPDIFLKHLFRIYLDHLVVKNIINQKNPDMVITLANLPSITRKYQLIFHDNAFITEPDLKNLNLGLISRQMHKFRRKLFFNRIKYVHKIIVQTELEKKRLTDMGWGKNKIEIITPLLPLHYSSFQIPSTSNFKKQDDPFKIACITRYYEHKNLEIIYELARISKKMNLNYQFILTISESEGIKAIRLIDRIKHNNFGNKIINLGTINPEQIGKLMKEIDALILPSLIETFGLNCIDAWYFRKPLFISDREFSRKVCGNSAFYFDPNDAADIMGCLNNMLGDPEKTEEVISAGQKKLAKLSTSKSICELLNKKIQ